MKNPNSAFLILRLGFALVFVWFASSQLQNPEAWTGFLPAFIDKLPISAVAFVKINALYEIISAALLILGVWVRPVALFLAVHLFGIAFTVGFEATGVRDFGLAIGALALAIGGAGSFSIDNRAK